MENVEKKQAEIVSLANDIASHPLRMSRMNMKKLFQKMSTADYMAMWILAQSVDKSKQDQRIYLEEIAEKTNLPMGKVSGIVKELQDRSLVRWKHDGSGEEGTYIEITEKGISSAVEQQEILKKFYNAVITEFGEERFLQFMGQIAELEEIMNQVIEKMGEE